MTETDRLDQIKHRAILATPGPWTWRGNVDHDCPRLVTRHGGGRFVLGTIPVDREATDRGIADYLDEIPEDARADTLDAYLRDQNGERMREHRLALAGEHGVLHEARGMGQFEVAPTATQRADPRVYRADIDGIHHPDATFIEHSRADIDWLIGEVERLRGALAGVDSATAAATR